MKRIIISIVVFSAAAVWLGMLIGGYILSNIGENIAFNNLMANIDCIDNCVDNQHPWQLVIGQDLLFLAAVIPVIILVFLFARVITQAVTQHAEGGH